MAAYIRRVNATGDAFAVVARKGAEEAGAIFIRVDRLNGTGDLYVPAPQSAYGEDKPSDRLFVTRFTGGPIENPRLDDALAREARLDPDVWVVAVEDRSGRHFLDDALLEHGD